jgi:hypothetical protein
VFTVSVAEAIHVAFETATGVLKYHAGGAGLYNPIGDQVGQ